ncbi:MAG: sortase family protein LPXTG-site transpeptidase [Actinomycetia bacterium]|nr:sortase family protein LPXTG-site transpeptidase [Actinomycetes bacterium]
MTLGLLILLFVAYQLWGTGVYESQQQDKLASQFQQEIRKQPTTTTTSGTAPAVTTTTAPTPAAPQGDAVGHIVIPKIGVDKYVVQGVGVPDLRKGPGHYPNTPMPGQAGNAAIAGHRTTYGAPFNRLDELNVDDQIQITTTQGTFTYKVDKQPYAVQPTQTDVLAPTTGATLTLTTCTPKFSASQRLIVQAALVLPKDQTPLPTAATTPAVATKSTESLAQAESAATGTSLAPTYLWGFFVLIVGGLWWLVFHRYQRWTVWLVGVIPFLAVLFVFYVYLERVLPQNY